METLKEQLFNKDTVTSLLTELDKYYSLDIERITDELLIEFETLELKERISSLTRALEREIDVPYLEVLDIFDKCVAGINRGHFVYASLIEYVEKRGVTDEFIDESLKRLAAYTSTFSSEFAIRTFINMYEAKTLKEVFKWSLSDNADIRRLASEGTRPLLPWAVKVNMDYRDSIKWLDNLYSDSERYVTRSVANHLNDISKIDPTLVVNTLTRWEKEGKQSLPEMKYIINHSLRTLVKRGNELALEFLGYNLNPVLMIKNLKVDKKEINIGDSVVMSFDIITNEEKLMIDYIVHFQTKSGKASKKVYKLKQINKKQDVISITKKIAFNQRTTRKIYKGIHKVDIQVNGKVIDSTELKVK